MINFKINIFIFKKKQQQQKNYTFICIFIFIYITKNMQKRVRRTMNKIPPKILSGMSEFLVL